MEDHPGHLALYFPPWTEDELCDANEALGLAVPKEFIRTRFEIFGGIARYCLSQDRIFVDVAIDKLKRELRRITSDAILRTHFEGTQRGISCVGDKIFHMIPERFPNTNFPCQYRIQIASQRIRDMLRERINDSDPEDLCNFH